MLPLSRDKVLLCCAPEITLEVAQEDMRRAREEYVRAVPDVPAVLMKGKEEEEEEDLCIVCLDSVANSR